jgi:hypothetical protein
MSNSKPVEPADVVVEICNGPRDQFRTISTKVIQAHLDIKNLTEKQIDAWSQSASVAGAADPGDVNSLPFAQSLIPSALTDQVRKWLDKQGIRDRKNIDGAGAKPSLLTCLGASFHNDALSFSDSIFAVVWLEEDAQWDLYFPQTQDRVELRLGTAVIFDGCLPHGVVKRGKTAYDHADFSDHDSSAGMVSFDLDVKNESVYKFMGIEFMHLDKVPASKITQRLDPDRFIHEIDMHTGTWNVRDKDLEPAAKKGLKP